MVAQSNPTRASEQKIPAKVLLFGKIAKFVTEFVAEWLSGYFQIVVGLKFSFIPMELLLREVKLFVD